MQYERSSAEGAMEWFLSVGFSRHMAEQFIEMYGAIEQRRVAPEEPRTAANTTPTTWEEFTNSAIVPAYHQAAARLAGARA